MHVSQRCKDYKWILRVILNNFSKQHPTIQQLILQLLVSHLKNHPNKTNKTCGTLLVQGTFFYGTQHMDVPVLADLQEPIYISSIHTLYVVCKTYPER